jgi:ArsR family transcriptional regulator, arsenate/arsenite/antimonite-responsive transcriptional repressor
VLSSATDLDVRPLSRLFRALGDETRLRIVALLGHGELCVCHVEQALDLSQPNASRQLGILRAAGVVDSRRDGTWVYYRIADQEHEAVQRVLGVLAESLSMRRALKSDLVRLRKSCGPDACR